ncbi:MAG: hypothetical protein KDC34_05095 [Saprospiraceae bacterium]|nr:hypothetical protein [Saprospiraceae bacterium]
MKKGSHSNPPQFEAFLWDGESQLSGRLELGVDAVLFKPTSFTDTHLQLIIPYARIQSVDEFLLYGIVRNGIKIRSQEDRVDDFIMEQAGTFKAALLFRLSL